MIILQDPKSLKSFQRFRIVFGDIVPKYIYQKPFFMRKKTSFIFLRTKWKQTIFLRNGELLCGIFG